mgnify:CR=1 FL=1
MPVTDRPAAPFVTHEVRNQVPPLRDRNLFEDNVPLVEGLEREGGGWARERASAVGAFWGGEPMEWGRLANEHEPVLRTHDRYGNRLDEVEFHPAWHQLMARGVADELHALPWNTEKDGAHVARAAIYMSGMQAEAGFCCPITMTFAAVPAFRATPELAEQWVPLLTAKTYDPELRPAAEKGSAICGMSSIATISSSTACAGSGSPAPSSAARTRGRSGPCR